MKDALLGFYDVVTGIATTPLSTFTIHLGQPGAVAVVGSGKTTGRHAWVHAVSGTAGREAAGDTHELVTVDIGVVLFDPADQDFAETEANATVVLDAIKQVATALEALTVKRRYTHDSRVYEASMDYDWQYAKVRPPWDSAQDYHILVAEWSVVLA